MAEVLEQKSKLETLRESGDDGLLVIGSNGSVSHCNECLAKLVGLQKQEIQNRNWIDLPTLNEN